MNFDGWQGNFVPAVPNIIASGGTDSTDPIACNGMDLVLMAIPSIMTGTAISFLAGDSTLGYQANGEILFGTNPANSDTLTINSVVITFVTLLTTGNQVLIGADTTATMAALQAFLDATAVAGLLALTYTSSGTLMTVKAVVHGTAGNAYTFAKSSTHITLTPAGGTLTGGGFRPVYDSSNALISVTVAAGRTYALPSTYTQGIQYLKLRSGSTELNDRTIYCSMKGI